LGSAVLVVTDNDAALAQRESERLAELLWSRRRDYLPELTPLDEAVRAAYERREGLTVLSDSADSTTSGAPGDSTWALKELLKYDWRGPVLVPMVAPDVVELARDQGPGAELSVELGGKRDHRFSTPIHVNARVERIFDARFVM